jgi:hypothetical protein
MNENEKKLFYGIGKYAVTINPENSKQYANSPDRYQKVINFLHEKLMALKEFNIDYVMYLEISEGSSKSSDKFYIGDTVTRIHGHGTIEFKYNKSIRWFLLYGIKILSKDCSVLISPLIDEESWTKYCQKQQHIIHDTPLTSSHNPYPRDGGSPVKLGILNDFGLL